MDKNDNAVMQNDPGAPQPSSFDLFLGFLILGMTSFGGVLPMARRMLVDKRRWLSPDDFLDMLGLCQFLPGGNIINLSVAVGMKHHGPRGAFAAIIGLIAMPMVVIVLLGMVYSNFSDDPVVKHAFAGLAASAAGLLVAMCVKVAKPLRGNWPGMAMALAMFLVIAVWRAPLLPSMLIMTPLSVLLLWKLRR